MENNESKILLVLDNRPHFIKHTKPITIYELIESTLQKQQNRNNKKDKDNKKDRNDYDIFINNYKNYFYLKNGIPALANSIIPVDNKTYYIVCSSRLKGGTDFTDIIGFVFMPIFKPIGSIANIFNLLIKFFVWVGNFIVWFVFFIGWLVTDLLNPLNLATDFFNTIKMILVALATGVLQLFMGLFSTVINSMGDWMQTFWGWDQSNLNQNDKNSKYFKSIDKNKGKKCYITDGNTVPFSVILGTVLCPPLGVFMDMGATGWLNIIICGLLTLLFYVPGLCYALLVIYS